MESDPDITGVDWLKKHIRLALFEGRTEKWKQKGIPLPPKLRFSDYGDPFRLCTYGDFRSVNLSFLKGTRRGFIEIDFSCSYGEDSFTGQRYGFIYRLDHLRKPTRLIPVWHGVTNHHATDMDRCEASWFLQFRVAKKGTLLQQRRKSGCHVKRLKRTRWKTIYTVPK